MAISFQNALGIHDTALRLRGQRAEVLAENLANADTPNYKARDLDFNAMLQNASARQNRGLEM
ncbi:MAG: flagellar basal body rod protein FlgB, partial [Cellvibrionaceae bacterium]|nr:flagellar basal body rod protein FlgB [Cellvibrionaceae bacterium]